MKSSLKYFHRKVLPKLKTFNNIYKIVRKFKHKLKDDVFEMITYYVYLLHPNYKNATKIYLVI